MDVDLRWLGGLAMGEFEHPQRRPPSSRVTITEMCGQRLDRLDGRNSNAYDTLVGGPGYDSAAYDGIDKLNGVEHRRFDPDLAAWQPATASGAEPTNPAERAVDGNVQDWWNSGGWPSQWLEVDLGVPKTIGLVRGIAMGYPSGGAILLLGKPTPDSPYRLLHAFHGPLADNEQIAFAPKKPWRNVRFLRLYVPSANGDVGWVAWHELSVYAPRKPALSNARIGATLRRLSAGN